MEDGWCGRTWAFGNEEGADAPELGHGNGEDKAGLRETMVEAFVFGPLADGREGCGPVTEIRNVEGVLNWEEAILSIQQLACSSGGPREVWASAVVLFLWSIRILCGVGRREAGHLYVEGFSPF